MRKQVWMLTAAILLVGCSAGSTPSDEISIPESNQSSSTYEIPEDKRVQDDEADLTLKYQDIASFDEFADLKSYLNNDEEKAGMKRTLLLNPVEIDSTEFPMYKDFGFSYKNKEDGNFEDVCCYEKFRTCADDTVGPFEDEGEDGISPYSIRFDCFFFPLISDSEIKGDIGYCSTTKVKFTLTQDDNVVGYIYSAFHGLQVLDFVKEYVKKNLTTFQL